MPVDFHLSPTSITFTKPGRYLLYTDDYDLLVVNDAIIAANSKPWLNIQSESGEPVQVGLIERGMAIYDTPLRTAADLWRVLKSSIPVFTRWSIPESRSISISFPII